MSEKTGPAKLNLRDQGTRRVYVASSWRNETQPSVVRAIRAAGHTAYDFRHPEEGDDGFHWSEIDGGWQRWTPERYRQALAHPVAERGFGNDYRAMQWADACVYVMPCGRSASLEAGWMIGSGRPTAVLLADGEPELMVKLAETNGGAICLDIVEVLEWLSRDRFRRTSG